MQLFYKLLQAVDISTLVKVFKVKFIRLGDPCVETYRVSTFKHFPYQADVLLIASEGFYFTGYRDRVKCFR